MKNKIIVALVFVGILCIVGGMYYVSTHKKSETLIQGHISRGQSFEKDMGNGMLFKLTPYENGWNVSIVSKNVGAHEYDFTLATPPFHGPTSLHIEGSDFGTTTTDSHHVRNFSFVLNTHDANIMADAISEFTEGKTTDFNPKIDTFGKGELVISNLKLGNAQSSSDAWIELMDFSVHLSYPLPFSEYLK